jgi:hypothetical protein
MQAIEAQWVAQGFPGAETVQSIARAEVDRLLRD